MVQGRAERLAGARLYAIVDLSYVADKELLPVTRELLEGGVDVIQLRAKGHEVTQITGWAEKLLPVCREAGVPFIVNDHPGVARETGADGVHVGQDDLAVDAVRAMVGAEAIVGKSTHSLVQARAAAREDVDYIGFGPLFGTPTKPDYPPIGLEDVAQVHRELDLPIFCIGGIKAENADKVLQAGARRLVIVSGILTADDRRAYVRGVRERFSS